MRIISICPASGLTGGIELIYQLTDAVNRHGGDAYLCMHPWTSSPVERAPYIRYRAPTIAPQEIRADDVLIIPETFSYTRARFPNNRAYLWWMSVDNFYASGRLIYALRKGFLPWHFYRLPTGGKSDGFEGHLVQSEYARLHLSSAGVRNTIWLSDYINDDFIKHESRQPPGKRRDIVAFNPAKGPTQSEAIRRASDFEFVPVTGLSRDSVARVLGEAKVYIDFGNHPGRDRIPREAAAMGCVVITNRRGSAENDVDIPIPNFLKIDDAFPDFPLKAAEGISEAMRSYTHMLGAIQPWVNRINAEKQQFDVDVEKLLSILATESAP